jgi:ABC-type glycerol-3-phosphate transport system substrate-binding protein
MLIFLLALLGGILFLAALAAFFWIRKPKARILVSSWGEPPENKILQGLIDDFRKTRPDILVELEAVPYGEYDTQIVKKFSEGKSPDVLFVSSQRLADYYPRGVLEPLTSYLREDPSVALEAFYPTLINWFTIHGDLYVMPRDIAPICVVYYNQKAFDEAGQSYPKDDWTVDDFLEAAIKLTRKDAEGKVNRWGFVEDFPLPENWIYTFGGRFVDDPHHPTRYMVNKPEFLKGIRFIADLIHKHQVMPSPSQVLKDRVSTSDMFTQGKAGMFLSGIWKTPLFREIRDFKWDIVPSPRAPWVSKTVIGGSSGYGMASTSKHKKEAWDLIAFLSGHDGQSEFATTGLVQPALIEAAQSPAFLDGQSPKNKNFLLRVVKYAIDDPLATNWLEVKRGIILPELDKVWNGEEAPERAVDNLWRELIKHPLNLREKNSP